MTLEERRKLVTERRRIGAIQMKHDYFLTKLSWIESDIGVKLTKDNVMQHYREIIRMPNIGKVYVNKLREYLEHGRG
jgi:hypothetical protein